MPSSLLDAEYCRNVVTRPLMCVASVAASVAAMALTLGHLQNIRNEELDAGAADPTGQAASIVAKEAGRFYDNGTVQDLTDKVNKFGNQYLEGYNPQGKSWEDNLLDEASSVAAPDAQANVDMRRAFARMAEVLNLKLDKAPYEVAVEPPQPATSGILPTRPDAWRAPPPPQ